MFKFEITHPNSFAERQRLERECVTSCGNYFVSHYISADKESCRLVKRNSGLSDKWPRRSDHMEMRGMRVAAGPFTQIIVILRD